MAKILPYPQVATNLIIHPPSLVVTFPSCSATLVKFFRNASFVNVNATYERDNATTNQGLFFRSKIAIKLVVDRLVSQNKIATSTISKPSSDKKLFKPI